MARHQLCIIIIIISVEESDVFKIKDADVNVKYYM